MHQVRFSYSIGRDTPVYPGTLPVNITSLKCIRKQDSCNTYMIAFSNHSGTHIDGPRHFFEKGRMVQEFTDTEFRFTCPCIIDCPQSSGEIILVEDFQASNIPSQCDAVVIRTGFSRFRQGAGDKYTKKNPCISPEAARWLKSNFKKLRAVGIDCISVSSIEHRQLGRETHRILLGGRHPILIIEDMFLPVDIPTIRELVVIPFFISGVDSLPCTVIGLVPEKRKR